MSEHWRSLWDLGLASAETPIAECLGQGVLNDVLLADPTFSRCVQVVPSSDLFGGPGRYVFHNTGINSGPRCGGGPHPDGGQYAGSSHLSRILCLDRLYGNALRALLRMPLAAASCGRTFRRSIFGGGLNVTFTAHCLAPALTAGLDLRFLSSPTRIQMARASSNASSRMTRPRNINAET